MFSPQINFQIRKWHKRIALVTALPLGLIVVTGVLLQLRGILSWVAPPQLHGQNAIPTLTAQQYLAIAKHSPEAGIKGWNDIQRIDIRPAKGIAVIRSKNGWELQVDSSSGKILSSSARAATWLIALHEGSWFHPAVARWIFLPAGILFLVVWASGLILGIRPKKPAGGASDWQRGL